MIKYNPKGHTEQRLSYPVPVHSIPTLPAIDDHILHFLLVCNFVTQIETNMIIYLSFTYFFHFIDKMLHVAYITVYFHCFA